MERWIGPISRTLCLRPGPQEELTESLWISVRQQALQLAVPLEQAVSRRANSLSSRYSCSETKNASSRRWQIGLFRSLGTYKGKHFVKHSRVISLQIRQALPSCVPLYPNRVLELKPFKQGISAALLDRTGRVSRIRISDFSRRP